MMSRQLRRRDTDPGNVGDEILILTSRPHNAVKILVGGD